MNSSKKRVRKTVVISLCSLLILGAGGIFAGAFSDTLSSYKNLNENEFSQKLSDMDVPELFDEVNKLSGEGVEYPELDDFAFALLENIERTPNRILINAITNKNNHPNLRKMCMELLDTKNEDENGNSTLTDKEGKKLEALLLDENEDASVKFYVIDILPRNDSTINALKTAIAVEEDVVSERALKILNFFAPEQARPIAEEYIKSGENVILGISTINYQMCNSQNNAEKDEWVKYLLSLLDEVKDAPDMYLNPGPDVSDASAMKSVAINSLKELSYPTSIYAILNSEYINNDTKESIIQERQGGTQFFSEILANNPTEYDIEMVMKAIDLAPYAGVALIEPLRAIVQDAEKTEDISALKEKVDMAVSLAEAETPYRPVLE